MVSETARVAPASKCSRRRIGAEYNLRELRRSGVLHKRIAQAINCGELGHAMDNPTGPDGDRARALLDSILRPIGGGAQGYSAQGFPMAAGGVDVSSALMSVRPGIRKIKKLVTTTSLITDQQEVIIPLPKSGYMERPIIRLEALSANTGLQIVQTASPQAITMNDIRSLVQKLRFELSSTVVPKSLSGIACDIIDNLDVAVVNANNNLVPTSSSEDFLAVPAIFEPPGSFRNRPHWAIRIDPETVYGGSDGTGIPCKNGKSGPVSNGGPLPVARFSRADSFGPPSVRSQIFKG